jgi:hypothetical protein
VRNDIVRWMADHPEFLMATGAALAGGARAVWRRARSIARRKRQNVEESTPCAHCGSTAAPEDASTDKRVPD